MLNKLKWLITFLGLKKYALWFYFFLMNSIQYQSRFIGKKIILFRTRSQRKKGYLNLTLHSDWLGFGARLIKVIELLKYSKEENLELNIKFSYVGLEKDDFFQKNFDLKNKSKRFSSKRYVKIKDSNDIVVGRDLNLGLTLKEANNLFFDEFAIKDEVLSVVEKFTEEEFKNSKVLGIHFRGTDKIGEAPRVQNDRLINEINFRLSLENYNKVFISSDESKVIDLVKSRIQNIDIIYRNDILRSNDGEQFHRDIKNSMELVNFEALCNILILSKTSFLLKSSSIMSDCCFIFNPNLNYNILNKPHSKELTWWPAKELLNRQQELI